MNEYAKFLEIFQSESEKGSVLVAATMLEEQLNLLISSYMINENQTFIKSLNFYTSTQLAFSLGLIYQSEYNAINSIRKIRNKFAHKWDITSLNDTEEIIKECVQLKTPHSEQIINGNKGFKINEPRTRFNLMASLLVTNITNRINEVSASRKSKILWTRTFDI
jgi:mannitol operon repressor